MKRFFALLLSAAMLSALAVPVSAAEATYKVADVSQVAYIEDDDGRLDLSGSVSRVPYGETMYFPLLNGGASGIDDAYTAYAAADKAYGTAQEAAKKAKTAQEQKQTAYNTAKAAYEEKKQHTPQEQWADLPARYALVELVNLHDESLEFEPIHRVCFDVDADELMKDFLAAYPGAHYGEGEGHTITYVFDTEVGKITIPKPTAQLPVGTLQDFLDQWMQTHSGRIDYVHGDDVTWELGRKPGNIGFLLPAMGKDELFKTVIFDGALPRKTFSMGEAHDKRFYLEARKIK